MSEVKEERGGGADKKREELGPGNTHSNTGSRRRYSRHGLGELTDACVHVRSQSDLDHPEQITGGVCAREPARYARVAFGPLLFEAEAHVERVVFGPNACVEACAVSNVHHWFVLATAFWHDEIRPCLCLPLLSLLLVSAL